MPRVFLCYRREDSAGSAGRLFDRLAARFGRQSVFMDVDTIRAGKTLPPASKTSSPVAMRSSRSSGATGLTPPRGVNVASMTPATGCGSRSRPRCRETPRSFRCLSKGRPCPRADQLPDALRLVAQRQAIEITESRFDYDTGRLIDAIKAGAGKGAAPGGSRFRTLLGPFSRHPKVALATGVVVVAIAVVATLAGQGVLTSGPAAPEEGVVDYAYMHTASPPSYANAVTSLDYRPKLLVARFDFKTRPRPSLPIFVDWLSPGQKLVAHVGKPNLPKVISSYQSESPLRAGAWVAVLLVGKHRVAKAVVTLGNGEPGGGRSGGGRGGAGAGATSPPVPPG